MKTRLLTRDRFVEGDLGDVLRFKIDDLESDPTTASATVAAINAMTGEALTLQASATISNITSRTDADFGVTYFSCDMAVEFADGDLDASIPLMLVSVVLEDDFRVTVPPKGFLIHVSEAGSVPPV